MNVGPLELMVIMVIAILVVGPQRTVEIIRAIGQMTSQLRKLSDEFTTVFQTQVWNVEQETRQAADDVASQASSPLAALSEVQAEIQALERDTRQALERAITGESESPPTEDSPEIREESG